MHAIKADDASEYALRGKRNRRGTLYTINSHVDILFGAKVALTVIELDCVSLTVINEWRGLYWQPVVSENAWLETDEPVGHVYYRLLVAITSLSVKGSDNCLSFVCGDVLNLVQTFPVVVCKFSPSPLPLLLFLLLLFLLLLFLLLLFLLFIIMSVVKVIICFADTGWMQLRLLPCYKSGVVFSE